DDPPLCGDRKTCQDTVTKNFFCAISCGGGSNEVCLAPKTTCSSGQCLAQCPKDDKSICIGNQKTCLDPTTGGTFCADSCTPPAQQICSSPTSCGANDSCTACLSCSQAQRCLSSDSCKLPNSPCTDGQCLPQCTPPNPAQCRSDQRVCKNTLTGATFCTDQPACPDGSKQACSSTTSCSATDSCTDCAVCKDTARCKQVVPPTSSKQCGNKIQEEGEQCDDGDTNNANECRNDCTGQPNVCGNGVKDGTEECDDGDTNNANTCKNSCTFQKTLTDVIILINGKELTGDNTVDTFDCIRGQTCPSGSTPTHTYTVLTPGVTQDGTPTTVSPSSVVWVVTGTNTEITDGTPTNPKIDLTAISEGTGTLTVTVKDDAGNQKQGSITLTSALTSSNDIISYTKMKVTVDGVEKGTDIFSCLRGQPCNGGAAITHSYGVKVFGINQQNQEVEITPVSILWNTGGVLKVEGDVATLKTASIKTFVEQYGSGSASVTVTARKKGADGKIELVSNTSTIQVTACANMWSYANSGYDFDMSYCADEGGQKLPVLQSGPTPLSGITRFNDPYEREYIFQFDPDTISASSTPAYREKLKTDVIALRVARNAKGVGGTTALSYAPSLNLWYTEKIGSTLPGIGTVDGFRALKEPVGTYVNAFVPSKNDFYVFYITANANASPETLQVYNQLVSRIFLAVSPTSVSERSEIKRDTQRLDDLEQIAKRLDEYKNASSVYPKLLAGSYLSGQTTSLWPSWQQNFGTELKATLPTDPKVTTCLSPYNENTCWDNTHKRFYTDLIVNGQEVVQILKNNQSLKAYVYKTPSSGTSYEMCTNLESSSVRLGRVVVNTAAYCISR
ncbi:MAG: hypothetical protein Q7R79_04145, partial [bacterium]|nr:hypothetical protein [bacterium]